MRNTCRRYLLTLLVAFFSIANLYWQAPVLAQDSDQTITFSTPAVELLYKPPFRSGLNSQYPAQSEVPKLNLVINLMENYLQYLSKLQKIAPDTTIKLFYAPDLAIDDYNDDRKIIRLRDLGLNQILQDINQHLREKATTEENYLLDNANSLFTIPDQLGRKTSKIAIRTELINHSSFQQSLEPDTDFCVIDEHRLITARPSKKNNRLHLMTDLNNVCSATLLLSHSKVWYANLKSCPNDDYISLTDGLLPLVLNLNASEPVRIFKDDDLVLLDSQWSPKEPILAGFVLNSQTLGRQFFLYDAKTKTNIPLTNSESLESNYYNAHPQWSPDGKKIILTSAKAVHIVDFTTKKFYPDVIRLPNEISELIWSENCKSFALVEIIGQARDRYAFDDLDYRKSVLHRYNISEDFTVIEDHAQRSESRHTIKLVSFWTLDRILYLQGRLISKRLNTPFWDLSKTFSAYLTRPPTTSAGRDAKEMEKRQTQVALPMQYLYVFRNLDGKYKNIYDCGFNHSNYAFAERFNNLWFIGLRKPEEVPSQENIFNHRLPPYPFIENNTTILTDTPPAKMEAVLKFMQDYSLRVANFNHDFSRIFMLANFSGPLNLWSGDFQKLIDGLNLRDE